MWAKNVSLPLKRSIHYLWYIIMKLYSLVQRFLGGRFVHYFVLFFITISILAVIASSFREMAPYRIPLFAVTYLSSFVFLLEFVARIFAAPARFPGKSVGKARLSYTFSFYGLVDFVAVLPCILAYFYWYTPTVHIIILPYIFIIFKLIRHSKSFRLIGRALSSVREELTTAYTACLIMVCFSAILMYYIERDAQPDVFQNIGDSFWWAIVAFTTVGYGDIYPITPLGKILSCIISMIGIAMIAIPTGIISSAFINIIQKKERRLWDETHPEDEPM